jgi:hypothetical protein
MSSTPSKTQQVLGPEAAMYLDLLHDILSHLTKHEYKYQFMDNDAYFAFLKEDPPNATAWYWVEMLQRAHLAAATSLLRGHAWLSGVEHAIESDNALAFAACWRGFMEAAADTWDGLGSAPETLANYHRDVSVALSGHAKAFPGCKELEDGLIHFAHARKLAKNEQAPESHEAKQPKEYFAQYKGNSAAVYSFYNDLCGFTHPAMPSVSAFLGDCPDASIMLTPAQGQKQIATLVAKHLAVVPLMLTTGLNSPLVLLKIVNHFGIENLQTPRLNSFRFDSMPIGKRIAKALGKAEW